MPITLPYNSKESLIETISDEDFMWRGMGRKNPKIYLEGGARSVVFFQDLLKRIGREITEDTRILDYGSGFGRITRHFVALQGRDKVAIAEPRPDATEFCVKNFGVKSYALKEPYNECKIEDTFDFIFAGSVFTHTCAEIWEQIFKLYEKVTSDAAVVLFTTAGESVVRLVEDGALGNLHPVAAQTMTSDFRINGYGYANYPDRVEEQYRPDSESLYRYGRCMVQPSWVNRFIEERTSFKLLYFQKQGWAGRQDIYAVSRN